MFRGGSTPQQPAEKDQPPLAVAQSAEWGHVTAQRASDRTLVAGAIGHDIPEHGLRVSLPVGWATNGSDERQHDSQALVCRGWRQKDEHRHCDVSS